MSKKPRVTFDLGLGLEALDEAGLFFRMKRLDLPVAFRDTL
jgi:hypothetical protein